MSKIIFITSNYVDSKAFKRIEDFRTAYYDVDVFCFDRKKSQYRDYDFPVTIVGSYSDDTPYIRRMEIIRKGISKITKRFSSKDDIIYYLDGIGVAAVAYFMIKHPYVYEECDLVHTYLGNPIVRGFYEVLDKRIIKKSLETILTSEGFAQYHYGVNKLPNNISYIFNKLNPKIKDYNLLQKIPVGINHLKFAFVGVPRFKSVSSFAKILLDNFPQHEFHLYGSINSKEALEFSTLEKYPNYYAHGRFQNPQDLSSIYSQVNIVISTYDVEFENVKYAEPNKLYEAIYFETPIVATKGTFLANKIHSLGVGYGVDPLSESDVITFVKGLTNESIHQISKQASLIDKNSLIDDNALFFEKLRSKMK